MWDNVTLALGKVVPKSKIDVPYTYSLVVTIGIEKYWELASARNGLCDRFLAYGVVHLGR